jgi:hypothetical protein
MDISHDYIDFEPLIPFLGSEGLFSCFMFFLLQNDGYHTTILIVVPN